MRDYGTATWEGGDADCDHVERQKGNTRGGLAAAANASDGGNRSQDNRRDNDNSFHGVQYRDTCGKCGARRIDNQIGLEPTVDAYVAKLVEVFREVRRVLHPSGVVFINLGDSYNGSGGAGGDYNEGGIREGQPKYPGRNVNGLGPKQLLGMPWRVAFALQADGWILRSDIIWAKPNPMPESVTDRPTKSHEYIFLLSKCREYFYDAEAIREAAVYGRTENADMYGRAREADPRDKRGNNKGANKIVPGTELSRNRRTVWTVTTEPTPMAHFATMPTKLVEPCILAGTSAYGACSKCLAPWARVVEREAQLEQGRKSLGYGTATDAGGFTTNGHGKSTLHHTATNTTTGWQPTCLCQADVVPCTVLDPFNGSGTTGAVALKHHRRYIGIDLNADYLELAHRRIQQSQPLLFALEVTP